ncbi:CASP-like protein 4A2 [Mus caroli]|uniref:CASP-like protein 4A2 n=1 Tax=Mus caroli TaxID=10089 RepID=A0A6P5QAM7_MUSCR|nr:CASP-like protein 4A2 [Mus caroli]
MSLRAGGGEGPSAGIPGRRIAASAASSHTQQLNAARPGVPARSPRVAKVGSGIAETQSRRRLYLRRRLEALQPELRPPPAPRLEWDGGAAGPVPSRFPFPRRGLSPRVPAPRPPPPPLLPLPLRGSPWTPPSSTRLASAEP